MFPSAAGGAERALCVRARVKSFGLSRQAGRSCGANCNCNCQKPKPKPTPKPRRSTPVTCCSRCSCVLVVSCEWPTAVSKEACVCSSCRTREASALARDEPHGESRDRTDTACHGRRPARLGDVCTRVCQRAGAGTRAGGGAYTHVRVPFLLLGRARLKVMLQL